MTMPPIRELRRRLREELLGAGIDARDADLLLSSVLHMSVARLIGCDLDLVSAAAQTEVHELVARRLLGEPLQYLLGTSEFFGRTFTVDSRALIPRPETELLVELAVARCPRNGRLLDVGSGSGAIGISVALERPDLTVMSSDISFDALALSRSNALHLGAGVRLIGSDLLDAIRGEFDMIVSNPPYVPEADVATLQREVRDYEPLLALTPGPTGLETVRRILEGVPARLRRGGIVAMEIGMGQSEVVRAMAIDTGWLVESFIDDFAGIPRVVVLSRTD